MATVQESQALGLMQLYGWSEADEMIQSQYGRVTIHEWLTREEERIASDPSRRAVIVTHGNRTTLFVNRVADR
ncbi:MAG: hypothetical protein Q8R30_01325 [bacterium]|nr:hypothetical protein [bacterium]MDZ4285824.1 hypothetical protein [Candidatus Sungbacteria bacterium]